MSVPGPLEELHHLSDVPALVDRAGEEYCWSLRFDAPFVAAVCRLGYLPMVYHWGSTALLLIKCHAQRMVLHFPDLRVSRSTLRRAEGLEFCSDGDLPGVLEGIARHHHNNWIVSPYRETLEELFCRQVDGVAVHTMEVYREGELVAGEVGYQCGAVYTSLSGFYEVSGAGAVQLACTARVLEQGRFAFWDLGMDAPYKDALGGRLWERHAFLEIYRSAAGGAPAAKDVLTAEGVPTAEEVPAAREAPTTGGEPPSVPKGRVGCRSLLTGATPASR